MTTLVLKDLPHFDQLERAAVRSVRGGVACLSREAPPSCHGGFIPQAPVQPVHVVWGGCPPVHSGCEPKRVPYGNLMCHPVGVAVPL
jgi:hypothetical protein